MNSILRISFFTLFFFFISGLTLNAQTSEGKMNKTNTITFGYVSNMFLDAAKPGLTVGYNKILGPEKDFVLESQFSYTFAYFDDNNYSFPDVTEAHHINILAGFRGYLAERGNNKTVVYANGLIGYTGRQQILLNVEEKDRSSHRLGYSFGAYLETPKGLVLGASVETLLSFVIKGGYNF